MFPDGTQKVVADLADSNLAPALDGVDAVFLLTDGLNIAAHDHRLVAAARLASVERIVKLSVLAVGHGATDPITTLHRAGEETSGLRSWTTGSPAGHARPGTPVHLSATGGGPSSLRLGRRVACPRFAASRRCPRRRGVR